MRFLRTLACIGVIVATFLVTPQALPNETVHSELVRLEKQYGLSLTSIRDNKIYTVSFANRSLNEGQSFLKVGTGSHGTLSPDGTRIAVELCRDPGFTHPVQGVTQCPAGFVLATMQRNGTDYREYPELANPSFMMCWSHDATKLALEVEDRRQGRYAPSDLQIVDLRTGATERVDDGSDAFVSSQCWSADDKEIVYMVNKDRGVQLVRVYNTVQKITREISKGGNPTWSPDGKRIALRYCPPSLHGCTCYSVRPDGSEEMVLFQDDGDTPLWWSPDSRLVAYIDGARAFERTPAQMLREMGRLRVRRLEDGSEDWLVDFFDGDTMWFQWTTNKPQTGSTRKP